MKICRIHQNPTLRRLVYSIQDSFALVSRLRTLAKLGAGHVRRVSPLGRDRSDRLDRLDRYNIGTMMVQ